VVKQLNDRLFKCRTPKKYAGALQVVLDDWAKKLATHGMYMTGHVRHGRDGEDESAEPAQKRQEQYIASLD